MISLREQQRLVHIVVFAFPMQGDMDVIILNREEGVLNAAPIGVMYVKEASVIVVVPFKDPPSVEQEMDKIVVVFHVQIVVHGVYLVVLVVLHVLLKIVLIFGAHEKITLTLTLTLKWRKFLPFLSRA